MVPKKKNGNFLEKTFMIFIAFELFMGTIFLNKCA
jgi:hypothetical protein